MPREPRIRKFGPTTGRLGETIPSGEHASKGGPAEAKWCGGELPLRHPGSDRLASLFRQLTKSLGAKWLASAISMLVPAHLCT